MTKAAASPMRDPYEVLGVAETADDAEVRAAYKRLALRLHPDKNKDGAEQFKEVVSAYAILSDPEKRRRFDLGGYDAFKEEDLNSVEIDLSALGVVNTAMAAMFSKLGVHIKTAVAPGVLEAAYEGRFAATPLAFGQRVQDRVDKQAAHFFELEVTQEHIDAGFVVSAYSSAGSRFKLLLFEQQADGQWELVAQEESSKMKKHTAAGLYCLPFDTFSVGPKLSNLETVNDPESALFKRLDGLTRREPLRVRPGKLVYAVYGDNYFKKVSFTLEAVLPSAASSTAEQVRAAERELSRKREELRAFEAEYRRVAAQYAEACARYEREAAEVEGLLGRREQAYLELLGIAAAGEGRELAAAASASAAGGPGGGEAGARQGSGSAAGGGDAAAGGSGEGRRVLGLGRLFSSKK